jgi:hypothetical protein
MRSRTTWALGGLVDVVGDGNLETVDPLEKA